MNKKLLQLIFTKLARTQNEPRTQDKPILVGLKQMNGVFYSRQSTVFILKLDLK